MINTPRYTLAVRWLCAGLLLAAAGTVIALALPALGGAQEVVTDTPGGASVRLTLDPAHPGLDGCFTASWAVEGAQWVQATYFFEPPEGDGAGTGTLSRCAEQDAFVTLSVELPDGSVHVYQRRVLVSTVRLLPVYGALALALTAGAGGLVWPRRPRTTRSNGPAARWVEPAVVVGLLLVTFAAYLPARFIVYGGDYEVHVFYAHQIANGAPITSPHFINQLLIIGLAHLLPGDLTTPDIYFDAQFWVNQGALLLTVGLIYGFLRYLIGAPHTLRATLWLGALTLGGAVAAPIIFPTLPGQSLFMGYIPSSNMFHNPTYTLMRPMAIALTWITLRLFREQAARPLLVAGAGAGLVVLSLITKPNHVILFVPAVGLLALASLLRDRRLRWIPALMAAAALPVLALQYAAFFTDAEAQRFTEPSRVIFAPLAAMLTREPRYTWMFAKLLLSSAFPLALVALYWQRARQDIGMGFAWAGYAVGLAYAYLLAEAGKVQHANFIFSAQAGLDVLMLISIGWFAREVWQANPPKDGRAALAGTLLALHVAAGVVWHAVNVASGYGFLWW